MPYFNEERKTFEVDGKPVTISTITIDGGENNIPNTETKNVVDVDIPQLSVLENTSYLVPKRVVDADRLISAIDPNGKYLGRDIQKAILDIMQGKYTNIRPIGGFLD